MRSSIERESEFEILYNTPDHSGSCEKMLFLDFEIIPLIRGIERFPLAKKEEPERERLLQEMLSIMEALLKWEREYLN